MPSRQSLALRYFPDSTPAVAVRRLRAWIKRCKELDAALNKGERAFDRRRQITVREEQLIMEYLGEPEEEE